MVTHYDQMDNYRLGVSGMIKLKRKYFSITNTKGLFQSLSKIIKIVSLFFK